MALESRVISNLLDQIDALQLENTRLQPVCVTGATGFLGAHVTKQLLEAGYTVHATTRSLEPSKVAHLTSLPGATTRLKLFKADLLSPADFAAPFAGVAGVFHTASPFFFKPNASSLNSSGEAYSEENMMKPAVEGTQGILEVARSAGTVKKVVVTASTACVYVNYGAKPPSYVYSEKDWTDEDVIRKKENWYSLSKLCAEKAALAFGKKSGIKICTINPTLIFGPMLQPSLNTSSESVLGLLNGSTDKIPNECRAFVDVRDVATAHILTYETPSAEGRYLCIGDCPSYVEVCSILRELEPGAAVPTELNEVLAANVMGAPVPHKTLTDCGRLEALGLRFRKVREQLEGTVAGLKQFGHFSGARL
jgi:nucleoside-diphosphate-sugar epimerase